MISLLKTQRLWHKKLHLSSNLKYSVFHDALVYASLKAILDFVCMLHMTSPWHGLTERLVTVILMSALLGHWTQRTVWQLNRSQYPWRQKLKCKAWASCPVFMTMIMFYYRVSHGIMTGWPVVNVMQRDCLTLSRCHGPAFLIILIMKSTWIPNWWN